MPNQRFKNRLKLARVESGLTQSELADRVGITRQTVGLIEAGGYNPSLKLCIQLARATNKTLDELFWMKGDS
jgi:putative transcriptional regulator